MNIYFENDPQKHKEESFKTRKERDKRAKQLRKEGWLVKCEKFSCIDMGLEDRYLLEASKDKGV